MQLSHLSSGSLLCVLAAIGCDPIPSSERCQSDTDCSQDQRCVAGRCQVDGDQRHDAAASDAAHSDTAINDAPNSDSTVSDTTVSDAATRDTTETRPDARADGVTIYDIQDITSADHPAEGTVVTLQGVVITAIDTRPSTTGFWVQEPGGGPYSGIFVYTPDDSTALSLAELRLGDVVTVTGTYSEFHDLSEISLTGGSISGHVAPPAPDLPADLDSQPERWEGVLVRLEGPCRVDVVRVEHGLVETSCFLLDDDIFEYDLTAGDSFSSITGTVHFGFDEYKLLPRSDADLPRSPPPDGGVGDAIVGDLLPAADALPRDAGSNDLRAPDVQTPDRGSANDSSASTDSTSHDAAGPDLYQPPDAGECGNGDVDPDEQCDLSIEPGMPGACPTSCPQLEPCLRRTRTDFGTCQARCVETEVEEVAPAGDMCCYASGDPDCPGDYPVYLDGEWTAHPDGNCNGYGDDWYAAWTESRVPLDTTCGVPVVLTFTNVSPGVGDSAFGDLDIRVETPGASYASVSERVDINGGYRGRGARLLIPPGEYPAYVISRWETRYCNRQDYESYAAWDYRPLESVPVVTTDAPAAPRVVGDHNGHFILYQDGNSVMVATGRLTPADLEWSAWFTSATYVAPSWTGAFTEIAPTGRAPTIAVESRAPIDDSITLPNAHVVWVESEGSVLRYARVTGAGEREAVQAIRSATGIDSPQLVRWDADNLGLVWTERADDASQLRFARLSLATGAINGDVVEVTTGEGDALEPALAARQDQTSGVAWIDTRSGQRQLFFQLIDGATGAITVAPELVSDAAVLPSDPNLQQVGGYPNFRILWTDQRDGHRALYLKDNFGVGRPSTVPFLTKLDARISSPGVDAHHGRMTGDPNDDLSYTDLTSTKLVWEVGSDGNQVRYGRAVAPYDDGYGHPYALTLGTGAPLLMTCDDSSSPDIFTAVPPVNMVARRSAATTLGAWIEEGQLVVQPLNTRTAARTPVQ